MQANHETRSYKGAPGRCATCGTQFLGCVPVTCDAWDCPLGIGPPWPPDDGQTIASLADPKDAA